MASLHKLLSREGFQTRNPQKPTKKVKFRHINTKQSSATLPISICHYRRSFDSSQQPSSVAASSVISERTDVKSVAEPARSEPDTVAILSGYVGQYTKNVSFRVNINERCRSCLQKRRKKKGFDSESFSLVEMGINTIDRLIASSVMNLDSLQKCIKNFNVVTSLNSSNSSDPSCRKTNSYLSSCANLYLSIIYKIVKNDMVSAWHLLQVFFDAPFLARSHLLPELWDHFFLPHLLHLKIWYNKELDYVRRLDEDERERKIKGLNRLYREKMDVGTIQFALYYKEWLKVGVQAPTVPTVPLPSKSTRSRRTSLESWNSHRSSSNLLYETVFGSNHQNGASRNIWDLQREEDVKVCNYVKKNYEMQKAEADSCSQDSRKSDHVKLSEIRIHSTDIDRALTTICSSDSLNDCEGSIRAVSKAWLDAHNSTHLKSSLSQPSIIQGILEVLHISNNDEILELGVSILAEITAQSEANRQCVLTTDPHLSVSIRLMRNNNLFLKAAVLLYLLKPKAKQMVSTEWIPLVLRVLEFGDQMETLFSVKCSPNEAAYYLLDQLLTGFDEDKNSDNAKEIIFSRGLDLLVRRMEVGDGNEKSRVASVLRRCIGADGSCRHYLVKNLKKDGILGLLVDENRGNCEEGHALALLSELLCISRRRKSIDFLNGLKEGWKRLNSLQILMLLLHRAHAADKPIIAVILLKLDLMGDVDECSVYRDEAIDAIIEALDCSVFDERIQLQAARALFILGGHFSYTGEQDVEKWLLRKVGTEGKNLTMNEDDKMSEKWQSKTALVLLKTGNKRLFSALSDSMANAIPRLARASLVTVCWISSYLYTLEKGDLRVEACSLLAPHLINYLINTTNTLEERILASFSLHSFAKGTGYRFQQLNIEKNLVDCLQKLSKATWTAKELISLVTVGSDDLFP